MDDQNVPTVDPKTDAPAEGEAEAPVEEAPVEEEAAA